VGVDGFGLGEADVVGEVGEDVGFGGRDLPVEQGGGDNNDLGKAALDRG
jgi:hypothetical protein